MCLFFFLKVKGELALAYENYADGILIVILIEILNDYYLFYLVVAGNNEPFRVTQIFCFFFLSICLSMCQPDCVSVHLFTINLKFLKTHNYWLGQLVYVSLVSGLELKNCWLLIKMLKNPSKNHVGGISVKVSDKAVSSAT